MTSPLVRKIDHTFTSWSDSLIEQTRSALHSPPVTIDDHLSMKNINGGFGKIGFSDLMTETWIITDRNSGATYLYESSDELIAAGWAID